ncbi:MAG: DoxX family protein [Anaerolineae bacterium]|nr:DoxX family protein [Anaerolineae bacterium]
MNIVLWIIQGLLAAMYLLAGIMKVLFTRKAKEQMAWAKRHPDNFIRFVGTMEFFGAIGLILPMLTGILPWLTPVAAIGLVLVQALAIFTEHLPNKEYNALPMNIGLLLLAAFVAYGRFL